MPQSEGTPPFPYKGSVTGSFEVVFIVKAQQGAGQIIAELSVIWHVEMTMWRHCDASLQGEEWDTFFAHDRVFPHGIRFSSASEITLKILGII